MKLYLSNIHFKICLVIVSVNNNQFLLECLECLLILILLK